ncbi:hypothetical protein TBLA_0D04080 [Henningerozyma blattae CBS 6284]|uniref:Uncharacterized protein n=1 Tax=Henningerozyma blattae (strain ATCC 34711 / CBS 6284 / DSM 70876 / NBRC 10599 / NRRL Y-10934 / UCD 77-7) TaxID=1071380 RepID=I2H3F3_HENB6|nr:hypothetical protein TBLA_0D04080 [Tetrapisispora blattae CBS 6284]CCH60905.1 hypothetical protein TBLA_0D04080 [Tetrapisispora blattae CBS 6284]
MSRASKITFGLSCLFTITTVGAVHFIQGLEQETLHQGPIKDAKRLAEKEKEKQEKELASTGSPKKPLMNAVPLSKRQTNAQEYQMQQDLTRQYTELQPLSGEVVTKDGEVIERSSPST